MKLKNVQIEKSTIRLLYSTKLGRQHATTIRDYEDAGVKDKISVLSLIEKGKGKEEKERVRKKEKKERRQIKERKRKRKRRESLGGGEQRRTCLQGP